MTTAALPGRPVSPWLDGRQPASRPALARDLDVDAVVIGGGIVGVTSALLLKREGARVALLEAERIGAGVTGRTTAKVTSLHGLIYGTLSSQHSLEVARAYGEANEAGVATVARLAEELQIDCDLRRKPSLTYSEDPGERGTIEDEVTAALAAGLPAAWAEDADLPFPIAGAIRVADQIELHPLGYLDGLAAALDEGERAVYERTRATGVSGTTVETAAGHKVRAGHVIVATQLPFPDRSLIFARAKPSRSCALSVRIEGAVPQGMHLSTEQPPHSLRALPWGDEELLIVAGEGHTMGQADPVESFRKLERYARERLGAVAVEHRWSAHDYIPEDSLPYIGRLWPRSDRVLMATGMQKWGLAMGTTAAGMLSDAVARRPAEWAEVFDPWRLPPPRSAFPLAKHNLNAAVHLFGDRLRWRREVDDLAPGEGRVVGAGPGRRAVHRDEEGSLRAVSARCTHLGCIVEWNGGDRTWDCPCHGSRFAASGEVLSGPATKPLSPRD